MHQVSAVLELDVQTLQKAFGIDAQYSISFCETYIIKYLLVLESNKILTAKLLSEEARCSRNI